MVDAFAFVVNLLVVIEVFKDLPNLSVDDLTKSVDVDFILRIVDFISIEGS